MHEASGASLEFLRRGTLRERLSFLLGNSCVYGAAAAAGKLLGLITLPVLTRALSPHEYGAVDAIAVCGAVLTVLVIMGLDSALARSFYETDCEQERRQVASQALALELAACLVVILTLLPRAGGLTCAWLGSAEYVSAVRILLCTLPFIVLFQFCQNLLKWSLLQRAFIVLTLGTLMLTVSCTLLFAVWLSMGVHGVFCGQLVGMVVGALGGLALCRGRLAWLRDGSHVLRLLSFGWPYMLIGCSVMLIPAFDRMFVTQYAGLDATGLYAAGAKLSLLVMLPAEAFQMAWGPFSLGLHRVENAATTYNTVLRYFTIMMTLAALGLVAAAEPLLSLLASRRYAEGAIVVLPLAMAAVARAIGWITGIGVDLSKRTYLSVISLLLSLGSSLLVMWWLATPWGLVGVAWGVLLGQIVGAVSQTAFAHRVWPLRFQWQSTAAMYLLALGAGVLLQAVPAPTRAFALLLRGVILATFAGVLWIAFVPASERRAVSRAGVSWMVWMLGSHAVPSTPAQPVQPERDRSAA